MWTGMKRRNRRLPHRCEDSLAARRRLRAWFRLCPGRWVREGEQELLATVLPDLFGYHLLQVGRPLEADLLSASRIRHRVILDQDCHGSGREAAAGSEVLWGQPGALPVASDSLDVVLLPHTLEFEDEPHQVLREVERCLIPEGHVVILGFNPWSLWGLWRFLIRWRRGVPWCGHFYSATRIRDWLALLGFDTVLAHGYFFRPPLPQGALMRRLGFLERAGRRWWSPLGGGYLLVAKKRVATLTPIKPRWRARRARLAAGLTEPTARRGQTEHE